MRSVLPVKALTLIATILLVLGLLVYEYGGRLLTQRHRVADFQWKLPSDRTLTLSDSLALEGIPLAFRSSSRDPAGWYPVPIAPESKASFMRKGRSPNAGLIILSNSNFAGQLYARVELDVNNHALNVVISHPK